MEGLAALGDFAESTTVVTRGYPASALAAASSLTTTQQHHAPDPHSLDLAAGPAQAWNTFTFWEYLFNIFLVDNIEKECSSIVG